MAFERITIDHDKIGGLPCIRDLRIPVSAVLGQLAAGREAREILENFPDLEPEDILAALARGAQLLCFSAVHRKDDPFRAGLIMAGRSGRCKIL